MTKTPDDIKKLRDLLALLGPYMELALPVHVYELSGQEGQGYDVAVVIDGDLRTLATCGTRPRADLVVAAINVLPALLDELEALRAVVEPAKRIDATLDWDGWYSTAPADTDVVKLHMALQALEKKT